MSLKLFTELRKFIPAEILISFITQKFIFLELAEDESEPQSNSLEASEDCTTIALNNLCRFNEHL